MPTAVSLFSGCGGSDFGLLDAGFEILLANDVLSYAAHFYTQNLPSTEFRNCDVAEIHSFPYADLLAGCYPCQGFSQGGVRNPDSRINFLYRQFDRALRQVKPKAFIVENVSGMQRTDFTHLLNNQIVRFRMAGYKVTWKLLNAIDYGVPQERSRIFIVGVRSDLEPKYAFPTPTHGSGRKPYLTIKDAIGHMPTWPEGDFCTEPFHWYYMSRNRYRSWNACSKTILSRSRHMPLHPVSPKMLRIHTDKWIFENNSPARRFSYREAAVLQGFPMNITFPDTAGMHSRYKVIGNAVPPPLFKAVASALPDIW